MTTHHTTSPRRAPKPRHGVVITRTMTEAEQLALIDTLPTASQLAARRFDRLAMR